MPGNMLIRAELDTTLGTMIAIADDSALYLLEFFDRKNLDNQLKKLPDFESGNNDILRSIQSELDLYFNGRLKSFQTPIHLQGSDFQLSAWNALRSITYGKTTSYSSQAQNLNKPTAYRAVANANAANKLAIIVPCHRIINNNGYLGGYAGGLVRKKWLIEHEKEN